MLLDSNKKTGYIQELRRPHGQKIGIICQNYLSGYYRGGRERIGNAGRHHTLEVTGDEMKEEEEREN